MSDSELNLSGFLRGRGSRSEVNPSPEKVGPRARDMGVILSRALSRSEQRRSEGDDEEVKIPTEEEQMAGHASSLGSAATELSRSIAEQRLQEFNRQRSKEKSDLSALPDVIQSLVEKRATLETGDSFPIQTLSVSSQDIENSLLDIISTGEASISCDFRLTSEHFQLLESKIFALQPTEVITKKDFVFKMADGSEESICEAYSIVLDDKTEILIATGQKTDDRGEKVSLRAMEGYVSIRLKDQVGGDDVKVKIEQAFARLGLGEVSLSSSDQLSIEKQAESYKKHHKTDSISDEILSSLSSRELGSGYITSQETGAGERYINQNDFILLHTSPIDNLAQVLKHGLISRMERYKRGIGQKNLPATPDMKSGGADSVFVGCFTPDNKSLDMLMPKRDVTFAFKPRLLDRQDWYAYNSAKFGSTKPEDLAESLSPAEFFASQKQENIMSNEIMLHRMVTVDDIDAIIVRDNESRDLVAAMLKSNGVSEVAGRPIDEVIIAADAYKNKLT